MLKGGRGRRFKLPTLIELYSHLFNQKFESAHNASADVEATALCLFKLLKDKKIHPASLSDNEDIYMNLSDLDLEKVKAHGIDHLKLFEESKKLKSDEQLDKTDSPITNEELIEDFQFAHLHAYTQFSILQSTSRISDLLKQCIDFSHDAIAVSYTHLRAHET